MKKIISCILSIAMLTLCLGGCGRPEEPNDEKPDAVDTDYQWDFSIDPDSWGQDNSLDAYSAVVNMPLLTEEPEEAVGGGGQRLFLGADRAFFYKKHLLGTARESWDELAYVDADEAKGSKRFDFGDWLYGIGPVAGTDHYISFGYEPPEEDEGENRYFLTERDENHQVVREIPLDFLASPADDLVLPDYLAADSAGTIHLVYQADEGQEYLLVSPEGELLSSTGSSASGLVPLCDGRIAFLESVWDDEGSFKRTDLQCMDIENGKPMLLASLKEHADYVTLLDEKTLLYADREGVYRSSLNGENPEPLYRWINHGITIGQGGVPAMLADAEGGISLIYEDSENYSYLCLQPTTEEVETRVIALAEINVTNGSRYKPIVTEFNKRYPRWHIELKSDYDETALLTQLGAGDGPVLVDTGMMGFENLEKLWEPLDAVLEQLDITEELVPSVMELGKIHGVQYGVVTDFWLYTLITGNKDLKEWDYDTFLQCIADSPGLEAVHDIYEGGNSGDLLFMMYLSGGIDDACFWDVEAGTTNFDSSEFRQALELAKKYFTSKEEVPYEKSMLEEGKVLVNRMSIAAPQDVAGIRIYYGEDANYIGYPTKDGSAHYITSRAPLTIRRTATKEEKEVAIAFVSFLLSYEGQQLLAKGINFDMSVRKDMLEEQIASMNRSTEAQLGTFSRKSIRLGDQVDIELDRSKLMHLIEIAEPWKSLPEELEDILYEELEGYFSGTITEDILIDHLESRVGLYLNERK